MKSKLYILVLLLLCLAPLCPVLAEGSWPDEAAIAEMIRELGDNQYSVRQAAVQKLRQAGALAVPALEAAAQSDDPEVAMTARELLPDARLGLVPAWPADLAEQARQLDQLSKADKTALLRQVMTRIPDLDTFAPFLLARLSAGNPDEAVAILAEALSTGKADLAQRLTEVLKPPMNDGQAAMLAWSWMLKGQPKAALTALAQCGSEVREVSTLRAKIIGRVVASSKKSSCTNFNSITIPDGVTRIGNEAFKECTSLTSITIPDSVTSIGRAAFAHCWRLSSITIGNGVTTIGPAAFYYCKSLSSITIPDSVTSIENWAFSYCFRLASITIPDSVTSIGNRAFSSCSSLTNISVATANPSYSSIDGVFFDKEKTLLIQYPARKTNISYSIPDSVTSIGDEAFRDCSNLTSISIPDSVTSIGDKVFQSCTSLTNISVATANPSYSSIDGVLFDKAKTRLIQYPAGQTNRTYSIPDSVTSIENAAFRGCTSLSSITIPDSVISIERLAFYSCSSLSNITIGNGVTTIGDAAFCSCSRLSSITIGNGVTSIGAEAFRDCSSLTSIKFKGNGPISTGKSVFLRSTPTIYRLSTATGWGDTFAGRPVALWDE